MKLNDVISRYKEISIPVRATFWFMTMSVIQKGIQFLATPIYTRLLTTEEYGYYSVYVTWQSIFMIIATLNLSAGVFNNGMLKYQDDRERFISSMQGLGNACTLIVFAIVILAYIPLNNIMKLDIPVVVGMFVSFFFRPSFDYWSQSHRYVFEYRPLVFWTILYVVVSTALGIGLIFVLSQRKYAIIFGTIITQIIWGIIFYWKNYIRGKQLFVKTYWIFAFKFNLPLIPHYLSFIILGQADKVMINTICGESEVGIYSLSYTISLMLSIVVNAISSVFAPWTYQKLKDAENSQIKKVTNIILIILSILVSLCVLVAPELIKFLGTEEYLAAIWIIPPVMLSCYYTLVYSLFANIEFYYEKSIIVMIASVMAAITNIILNAIFIPKYGFVAAGYTTFICYALLAVIHYVFMRQFTDKNETKELYDIKFIIINSILLSVCAILLTNTYKFIVVRYVIVAIILTILVIFRKKFISIYKEIKQ